MLCRRTSDASIRSQACSLLSCQPLELEEQLLDRLQSTAADAIAARSQLTAKRRHRQQTLRQQQQQVDSSAGRARATVASEPQSGVVLRQARAGPAGSIDSALDTATQAEPDIIDAAGDDVHFARCGWQTADAAHQSQLQLQIMDSNKHQPDDQAFGGHLQQHQPEGLWDDDDVQQWPIEPPAALQENSCEPDRQQIWEAVSPPEYDYLQERQQPQMMAGLQHVTGQQQPFNAWGVDHQNHWRTDVLKQQDQQLQQLQDPRLQGVDWQGFPVTAAVAATSREYHSQSTERGVFREAGHHKEKKRFSGSAAADLF